MTLLWPTAASWFIDGPASLFSPRELSEEACRSS
jgi:hypothetical protein